MSDYPIPSYAAHIWLAGDTLWLGFPPLTEGGSSHSVPYPANERGITLIIETLRERRKGERSLGSHGSPTKYQTERALVDDRKYNILLRALRESKAATEKEKQDATAFLEELGL